MSDLTKNKYQLQNESNNNYTTSFNKKYISSDLAKNEILELLEEENESDNLKLSNGRWSPKEHLLFIKGCLLYENNWRLVKKYIKTRSCSQIRSHAQKYLNKLNKKYYGTKNPIESSDFTLQLSSEEIQRLVNKAKFNEKDMSDAELYILSIFKGNKENKENKEREREQILNNMDKENEDFSDKEDEKDNNINYNEDNEKIFSVAKIGKNKKNFTDNNSIDNNNKNNININENEINVENNNNIDKTEINKNYISNNDNNYNNDNNNISYNNENNIEKDEFTVKNEQFINKCLNSKNVKDLIKLLKYYNCDFNFQVENKDILKDYQEYLKLDSEEEESNNSNNRNIISGKNENTIQNVNNIPNIVPCLIAQNPNIPINPLYNTKIMINPQFIDHY